VGVGDAAVLEAEGFEEGSADCLDGSIFDMVAEAVGVDDGAESPAGGGMGETTEPIPISCA
jgi:hypothetical protein